MIFSSKLAKLFASGFFVIFIVIIPVMILLDNRFVTVASYYGVIGSVIGIIAGITLFLKKEFLKAAAAFLFSITTFFYSYQSLFSGFNNIDKNGALIDRPSPLISALTWMTWGCLSIVAVSKIPHKKTVKDRLIKLTFGVFGMAMLVSGSFDLFDIARGPVTAVSEIKDKTLRHSGNSWYPYYDLKIYIDPNINGFSVSQVIYNQVDKGDRVEVSYYPRSKQLKSIRKLKTVSASYIYKDPLNIFTVEYPVNWFEKVVPATPHIPRGQEQPTRASCNKNEMKLCLDEIISVKVVPNPNKLPLREMVISVNQEATQDYGAISDPDFQIHGVILGISTKGLILDNISLVNLVRKIYFEHKGQVIEVTLFDIGDDDIGQFSNTFKLVNS